MANEIDASGSAVPAAVPSTAGSAGERDAGAESVGRYLSLQRRMRGISLEELSEITRIPMRSLERLESGRFDGNADGFVRGFVRTVGEALGLDPDDTVTRLLSEVQVESEVGGTRVSLHRAAFAVAIVLALATVLGLSRWIVSGVSSGPDEASRIVYRQDPVRALADVVRAQGTVPRPETGTAPPPDEPDAEPTRTANAPPP